MDFEGIGRVATNTTLAACAAGLTAMIYAYIPSKGWGANFIINGFLAGLVAISCQCYREFLKFEIAIDSNHDD
jgi:ammonium transporter, Amt family